MRTTHAMRLIAAAAIVLAQAPARVPAQPSAPPNAPAEVHLDGAHLRLQYHGVTVFDGRVEDPTAARSIVPTVVRRGSAVDQTVSIVAKGRTPLVLTGIVAATGQAFTCESDRPLRARPIVRHASGPSRSLLDQAVYDRQWDWVLSVDDHPRTRVEVSPVADRQGGRTFALTARGSEIVLRFRPRFYQQHRGLAYFEPWTYDTWTRPIVGWCSWFAFFDKVTAADIERTADVMSEVLRPYGYEYLQIDDGYQRATGLPEFWLNANEKFPRGLPALADSIRRRGLTPGIWTNATFSQTDFARQHAGWFVLDPSGQPARGNWIDHPVDATAPGALDALVRPIYRGLREAGWEYFKLDALRHLRYEGYNTYRSHFARKGVEPGDALRAYVTAVRDEIGRDHFLLACWGIRPELVGLVDGCRIGTDGFSYAGLAQYNSFNNIVWRNDPDHIELSQTEAWRSTMVTSLTGSLFLLTDKPDRYRTALVDPARRAAPVLVTRPGQLYDVDPSRSAALGRVDAEVSGRDPKPFDASLTPSVHLFQLDVNRPWGAWTVVGRTGGSGDEIRFEDLGLDPKEPRVVFEFWQKMPVATSSTGFVPGPLPTPFNSQVFIIRPRLDRPQLVATSRHITGGAVDVMALDWADEALVGRSRVVGADPYLLYLTEPTGWTLQDVECSAGQPLRVERQHGQAVAGCLVPESREIQWRARFQRADRVGSKGLGVVPPGAR